MKVAKQNCIAPSKCPEAASMLLKQVWNLLRANFLRAGQGKEKEKITSGSSNDDKDL